MAGGKDSKILGEKAVAAVGAGGCMLGIYKYVVDVVNEAREAYPCIDELGGGDYACDGRLGRNRFYDGDISAVQQVPPTYGIVSRHVYEIAGRNAPRLEKRIEERIKAAGNDELIDAARGDELDEFTIVMCISAVSGAGYVICRRLARHLNPRKPFGGMIRIHNIPSILEPGVELTLRYFLNEGELPAHVKSVMISTDVAHLVYKHLISSPNLMTMRSLRASIGDPQRLLAHVRKISFHAVDELISKIYAVMFLGSLARDLSLLHEGNVKRLDSHDLINFLGDGQYFVVSAFSTDVLLAHDLDLDDVVALGVAMPMVAGEAEAFLEDYSIMLPRKATPILSRMRLSRRRGRIKGIAVSDILDRYDVGLAFIRIDKERFKEVYEKFVGVP